MTAKEVGEGEPQEKDTYFVSIRIKFEKKNPAKPNNLLSRDTNIWYKYKDKKRKSSLQLRIIVTSEEGGEAGE